MIDWLQVGTDFQQKYENTFCRYISPISKKREVFKVTQVTPKNKEGPDITLFNHRVGDLYLNYHTEAELDFTFPECANFMSEKKALRFSRNFMRQWKKGLCDTTAAIHFPYNELYMSKHFGLTEQLLEDAFSPQRTISFKEAFNLIDNEEYFSVPLNRHMSVGHSDNKNDLWLWFGSELIARIRKNGSGLREIQTYVDDFNQEIQDFLRLTGDYARPVIQAT